MAWHFSDHFKKIVFIPGILDILGVHGGDCQALMTLFKNLQDQKNSEDGDNKEEENKKNIAH